MKRQNSILRMISDSDIVYIDDKTIKNRWKTPDISHHNINSKELEEYYITSFNRDSNKGHRILCLTSNYIL